MNESITTSEFDGFEIWTPGGKQNCRLPYSSRACVYFDKDGRMYIPNSTYEIMEEPKFVEVYFDKVRSRIAFRKCDKNAPKKYIVRTTSDHATISVSGLANKCKMLPKTGLQGYYILANDRTIIIETKQKSWMADWERDD